jgi:hypothetical protein
MRDSNPRMSAPKADALPLGESPVSARTNCTLTEVIAQGVEGGITLF